MGRGSSKVSSGGGGGGGKAPSVNANGPLSFKDKNELFKWMKANYIPGATEWTRFSAPRGHVYIMPGDMYEHRKLIGALNDAGIQHSQIMGFTQRLKGTDMMLGPVDIRLNNAPKAKTKAKSKGKAKKK